MPSSPLPGDPDGSQQQQPPPPNPLLVVAAAYEAFVDRTPLVTRYLLTGQFVSYAASYVVDPHFALSNIPRFTLYNLELYRLILSPAVNTSLFSLAFAFLSFGDLGKRLELRIGSAAFAWLCVAVAFAVNVAFLLVCWAGYAATGNELWMFRSAQSIWLILFAIVAMECAAQSPQHELTGGRRMVFGMSVQTKYYPLILYCLFALLNQDASIGFLLSLLLGYAIGHDGVASPRLEPVFFPSSVKVQQWEDTVLSRCTTRRGWVTGSAATGVSVSAETAGGSVVGSLVRSIVLAG